MSSFTDTPDALPVLSRGRHRSPRKGACFMEVASFLAGESWSDHPSCTHELLASLARKVNDAVGDDARCRLAPLIPDVIGLTSADPRVDARLALASATAALPVAPQARQNVLTVGLLTCERVLAALDGRPTQEPSPASRYVLDQVPLAHAWARDFAGGSVPSSRAFRRTAAPTIVGVAVEGIAEAAVTDPDDRLIDLLGEAIDLVRSLAAPRRAPERIGALTAG